MVKYAGRLAMDCEKERLRLSLETSGLAAPTKHTGHCGRSRLPPCTRTSNILVSGKGEPVISDLNLYLMHRDSDHSGLAIKSLRSAMSVWNPWCLASELLHAFEDAPSDLRSDVYAIEMVTPEVNSQL